MTVANINLPRILRVGAGAGVGAGVGVGVGAVVGPPNRAPALTIESAMK
mgnify:CR=1 FL=1